MNAPSDSLSGTSIDDTDTLVDSSVHHHQPDYTLPHPYPAHLTASQKKILSQVKPSRWSTPEFYFYGIAFLFVVPYMFKVAIDLSSDELPNYALYAHRLTQGWIFDRQVDDSDPQYGGFRDNLPLLIPVVIAYSFLSRLLTYLVRHQPLESRQAWRINFIILSSAIFMLIAFGSGFLKMLLILLINFAISAQFRNHRANPILSWIWTLGILLINEWYPWKFADFSFLLAPLDAHTGILGRWEVHFNFSMLRMISYNLDYFWATRQDYQTLEEARPPPSPSSSSSPSSPSPKQRVQRPLPLSEYSLINYFAYTLYLPLFLAGPIITFNDFISQIRLPRVELQKPSFILKYALRWVAVALLMEFLLHYIYVVAISNTKSWSGFSPMQISMIGYFILNNIWLKLLIIWRFFRLWAMADGILTEENMTRCMSNNYGAQDFWRHWHRSYNRWTIRYIYIPLGGTRYAMYNIWVIFTFVALWHDLRLRLLAWGWLVSLFILPEFLCIYLTKPLRKKPWFRHLAAVGAVFNILMMMTANLVGFAVGIDGMKQMVADIFTPQGAWFVLGSLSCLFIAVQVMFEYREMIKRREAQAILDDVNGKHHVNS
ncbi:MAG: MBOAT, membrane-bound O-acyltransferase family-domain-containing protein [Piptocephalis tieghemiana]|nr:MAG: MBOAT, membrane-bound O-acyltransferase family-domain-containing protein [Piptocephalis tieghemiana]